MKQIRRLAIVGILVFVLIFTVSASVMAAPSLKWCTDSVYYDNQGNLVVAGYFYNDGTRTVTWVNWMNIQVYFRNIATNWWLKTKTTFRDLNVCIQPGETSRWTLRITDVNYSYCDYWYVDWQADYNYQ